MSETCGTISKGLTCMLWEFQKTSKRKGQKKYLNNDHKLPKFCENINLLIQEGRQIPSKINTQKKHIRAYHSQASERRKKKKISKAVGLKGRIAYRVTSISATDFSSETLEARRHGITYSKC